MVEQDVFASEIDYVDKPFVTNIRESEIDNENQIKEKLLSDDESKNMIIEEIDEVNQEVFKNNNI